MRTKTLLLTAALSAAGIATSMAQGVLSVNSVGYVNASVPANKLAIISIPLDGMDGGAINNNMSNTIKLPDPGSDGCILFRFNVTTQNYLDPFQWFDGFGWFDTNPTPNPNDSIINPGEGIWLQNVTANPVPVVFTGQVPMGAALPNAIPGNPRLKIAASVVPVAGAVGGTDQAVHGNPRATLYFPAAENDIVFVWDVNGQNYKEPYQYFPAFGWFSANVDDPGPQGPTIAVGTGFWIQKGQDAMGNPNPPATWSQSYSVADGYNYNL